MFDQDAGLGEAMGRSHDRSTVARLAAIVLKAISGVPVTPSEMDELRNIAAADKATPQPLTKEQPQFIIAGYSRSSIMGY